MPDATQAPPPPPQQPQSTQPKPQAFPCPACSATMVFDPASGGMKCPYCGSKQAVKATGEVPTHSYDEALKGHRTGAQTLSDKALQVNCTSCGGSVIFVPPEVAGSCSFCGIALVAEPKAADPLIAPDAVLPAKIVKTVARDSVKQWLSTRWFAPNALKKMAQQEGISAVYLPFWTYDCDTHTNYVGERGEHYYETEEYWEDDGQGNRTRQTREVQHTRWYPASGRISRSFDDVLIAATKTVNEKRLSKLQPWNLEELRTYEPAFLAGFKAQRYQLELGEGFGNAQGVMRPQIEHDVRSDIGGDEQRVININTEYSNVMFRHLLLPVWLGAYRFQSKAYQVMVNATTGEVQGERPYSVAKITLLVLAILLAIALLVMASNNKSSHQKYRQQPPYGPTNHLVMPDGNGMHAELRKPMAQRVPSVFHVAAAVNGSRAMDGVPGMRWVASA